MAYLSALEMARGNLWLMRPDVFETLQQHMELFERETGRRTFVPAHGGVRTDEEQTELRADSLAQGAGALAYPVASLRSAAHPKGAAYDLHIVDGRNDNNNPDPLFAKLAEIGERLGMRAGYRWAGKQRDVFHFETTESPDERAAQWDALTRERLWRSLILLACAVLALWWALK